MTRILSLQLLAALAALIVVSPPIRADQPKTTPAVPPLVAAIQSRAPALLNYLQNEKKYKTVGVLKFEVRRVDGTGLEDVGEQNMILANRTELTLCKARDPEIDTLMVIHKASMFVNEKKPRADHRTVKGREEFFHNNKYLPEFGSGKNKDGTVEVDAFVVGIATFSADLSRIKIEYQVFDKEGGCGMIPPNLVAAIDVKTDAATLGDARKSYAISPAALAGPPGLVPEAVLKSVHQNEAIEKASNGCEPLQALKDSPVQWDILQGNETLQVNGSRVREPVSGKSLAFRLTNRNGGAYAVVLMVNGKNTLYEERYSALSCRKWVLDKPGTTLTVGGFQTEQNKQQTFKVLDGAEASEQFNADEMNYKDGTAGTFRLVVFAGQIKTKPTQAASAPPVPNNLVVGGVRGTPRSEDWKQPSDLKDAMSQLHKGDRFSIAGRGNSYVSKGATVVDNPTTDVYFELASEIPVADITLRYTTP